MSLFIGNLSRRVTANELEKVFGEYGPCKINFFGKYAFAEFDSEKDAEGAQENLLSKNLGGTQINVEWSKKSRKFDPSKIKPRRSSRSPIKREGRCYNCGSRNHLIKDCRYFFNLNFLEKELIEEDIEADLEVDLEEDQDLEIEIEGILDLDPQDQGQNLDHIAIEEESQILGVEGIITIVLVRRDRKIEVNLVIVKGEIIEMEKVRIEVGMKREMIRQM